MRSAWDSSFSEKALSVNISLGLRSSLNKIYKSPHSRSRRPLWDWCYLFRVSNSELLFLSLPKLVSLFHSFTFSQKNTFSSCDLWILAYNLNWRTWPGEGKDELSCRLSRSQVVSYNSYRANTQINQTDCKTWTTECSVKAMLEQRQWVEMREQQGIAPLAAKWYGHPFSPRRRMASTSSMGFPISVL